MHHLRPSRFHRSHLMLAACLLVGTLGSISAGAQPDAPGEARPARSSPDHTREHTPEHAPSPYVRVEDDGRTVRLGVAVREFAPRASSGPRVALVGAVHIGQAEYYAALQEYMSAYDIVLFEGVGGGPNAERLRAPDADEGERDPREAAEQDRSTPKGVQARLAEALGLEFQLEAVDYARENWRNSDMSIDEIRAELDASPAGAAAGDQIFGALSGRGMSARIANLILRFVENSDAARRGARVLIIDVLEMSDEMMLSLPGGMGDLMRVLIVDRNEKVLRDLGAIIEAEPEVRSIAIFYGAGHLLDMEASLVERFGYQPDGTTWFNAIEADLGEASGGLAAMRSMVRTSMQMQLEMMRRAAEAQSRTKDTPRPEHATETAPARGS